MRQQNAYWYPFKGDWVKFMLAQRVSRFKRRVFKTRSRSSSSSRLPKSFTNNSYDVLSSTDVPDTPSNRNHNIPKEIRMRNLPIRQNPGRCLLPCKWSLCKVLSFVNVIGALCLILFSPQIFNRNYNSASNDKVQRWTSKLNFNTCHFPTLHPFAEEVLPFIKPISTLRCHHTANPIGKRIFEVDRGTRILRRIQDEYESCCYRPFFRITDNRQDLSRQCFKIKSNFTEIPVEYEYIEVICVGPEDYSDGFAIVSRDKLNYENTSVPEEAKSDHKEGVSKLNVIILGIDATSRMNFLRKMPKSHDYLIHNLSAVEMKGYNKVAENTLPNVVPLLTGMTLEEMKQKCIPSGTTGEYVRIDTCPFVWHAFSVNGYKTSFAEDDVDIAIFNMDWRLAFEHPPTDFYLRPFTTLMQRKHLSGFNQCLGTRLSFKVLLDNIENFATAMHNFSSYFQFTWATRISHDDINKLGLGDDPLLETLEFMNDNGHLNNTALFVMSDHGSRLDKGIRSTAQGKLEDRMPLLYIVLPPWFKTQFPSAWENININSNRLMSAFDIHATFKDLMHLDNLNQHPVKKRKTTQGSLISFRNASSVFQLLTPNRTCSEAGIPMHWCTCFNKTPLALGSDDAKAAATFVVRHINSILSYQWKCSTLSLSKIIEAFEVDQADIVFNEPKTNSETIQVIHIAFETKPGNANFEATIMGVNKEWGITEKPARINAYEGQSSCVEQEYKPYCFCKG